MRPAHPWFRLRLMVLASLALVALLLPMVASAAPTTPAVEAAGAWGANCSSWHTVRHGETLNGIARFYGVSANAIAQANGISNPSRILVGQTLCIPGGGGWNPGPGGNCAFTHTVQRGETLSGIARTYGVSMWSIMEANRLLNANHIWVGQRLCIPGGTGGPGPQPPADGCFITHVVARGDTLTKIAGWYGTSVSAIMRANGLSNPNHIWVGQHLRVPTGCTAPEPEPPPWPNPCDWNCNPPPVVPTPTPCPCPPVFPTPVPPTPVPPVPSGPWTGEFFNNTTLAGSPVGGMQFAEIGFNWGTGGPGFGLPGNQFSARFVRTEFFQAGTYRFYATSDDGIRVFVNDQQIIEGWKIQAPTTYFGDIALPQGNHVIRIEYFQDGGEALLYVNNARIW